MKKNSIAKNYIYNLVYQLLTIVLPLITVPYISRILGPNQIGIYGYTTSILAYFILFGSLGISMYGQREIAYYQDNREKKSKTFWELIIIRTITLSISLVLYYFVCIRNETYGFYYVILLIQLLANAFDISWYFQGIEEFDKTVIRNLIVKILCLASIFIFVKEYSDLWKYFLIYAAAEFIGNASIWFYVPKYIDRVKPKELQFKKHIKPVMTLFLPQIAIQIYTVLDKTMIGFITNNMDEVGFYEQAQKIVKAGAMVLNALQVVMISRIANAFAKKDKKELHSCLEKSINFVSLIGIPMMLGIMAIAKKFVPWYFGDGFESVILLLITTSPILFITGLNGITGVQYLVQIGKQKEFTKSVIVGCIVNVILNTILIMRYNAIGAVIASLVAEISVLLYQMRYFKKEFNLLQIFKISANKFISGFVMFGVVLLLVKYLPVSIINTFIEIIVGGIIYILLLLILKDQFFLDLSNQVIKTVNSKLRK